jgi:hypothetical protein
MHVQTTSPSLHFEDLVIDPLKAEPKIETQEPPMRGLFCNGQTGRTIVRMPTCFVIQPFDSGKFDKRYEQVFKPAIVAADLEPYRVDQDLRVDIPIDAIESGIREAAVCLADITTDNPNVWYELGYAFAVGKPVVMVCSKERDKYPFDIQHRTVISYTADAPNDFSTLQDKITARLVAGL